MSHTFTRSRREYQYVVSTIPGAAWVAGFAAFYGVFAFATAVGQTYATLLSMGLAAIPAVVARLMLQSAFIDPEEHDLDQKR